MDYEKLIKAVNLCGSTPKVEQCKKCAYWAGGDMSKCIPRMTTEAATALSTLQTENQALRNAANGFKAENDKLRAELEQVKRTLAMMWFSYVNSDKEMPHSYETEALEDAERILGPWAECMPKYLKHGTKED